MVDTIPKIEPAVLVMSCDAFEDVWHPFFVLFGRYWPDCPFPVYFCTETKPCKQPGITPLLPGKLPWSARLRYAIDAIPQEYILFLQDDFFLIKKADSQRI